MNLYLEMSELSFHFEDNFSGLTNDCPSKIYCLIFSICGSYFTLFMSCCIIWHKKRGSDFKQTIINRLFSICWFYVIAWLLFPQHVEILRYLFGPLNKLICHASVFSTFFLTINLIVVLDFIVVLRYVFIFVLRNPAGFQDEFWTWFIF